VNSNVGTEEMSLRLSWGQELRKRELCIEALRMAVDDLKKVRIPGLGYSLLSIKIKLLTQLKLPFVVIREFNQAVGKSNSLMLMVAERY